MPRSFLALAIASLCLTPVLAGVPPRLSGGTATMYLGTYPDRILVIDESTETVKDAIRLKTGLPINMVLSQNRQRFYVITSYFEDIEIVDIASRKVVDTFRLSEGTKRVRIGGFQVDPTERYMVLTARAATRLTDRWEIGPARLVLYDLRAHTITREIPWPDDEELDPGTLLYASALLFSPDGRFLYLFSRDIHVYETNGYRHVDKWQFSRPIEAGFGRMRFTSFDILNEEPGYVTGLFTTEDPVDHRRILGVARLNLVEKRIDFTAIAPATDPVGSFTLAPGRKLAYGLLQRVGHYEFWTFDLEGRRLLRRTELPGRPRMSVKASSNGKLLYIHEAGNTIDLYDASSYSYLRTMALDGDMTTDLFILSSAR